MTRIEAPTAVHVSFDGRGEKSAYRGNGRLQLEAQGDNTILHYDGDVAVEGGLAELPPRLLQANLKGIIRRSLQGVDRALWPEQFPPTPRTRSITLWPAWAGPVLAAGLLALGGLIVARAIGKKRTAV